MLRALDEAGVQRGDRVLKLDAAGGDCRTGSTRASSSRHGVTLSREQLKWAQDRLHAAGLSELADLRYQDYRDLAQQNESAPFDAIVSIEMFEAVGGVNTGPATSKPFAAAWKPGGKACVQTITIRDDLFDHM